MTMNLIAMSSSTGTILTVGILVLIALILGVIVITTDTNWFD